jgi:chorismate synthase
MLRFVTAGESHGRALVVILEGVPAGMPLGADEITHQLARRRHGYGRGARMQLEQDHLTILSGVRHGETLGSPIALQIDNAEWAKWAEVMDPAPRRQPSGDAGTGDAAAGDHAAPRAVTRVRPGHADLAGALKYDRMDARDILERASARETAARVAAAAVCKVLLHHMGITVASHVVELGGVCSASSVYGSVPLPPVASLTAVADASPVRMLDAEAATLAMARIDAARVDGDTLGGICEVMVHGLPVGLGSHVSWDRKLDGRLGQAMLSIPAVKGVEIGLGVASARTTGATMHDPIEVAMSQPRAGSVQRTSNRAGGLEGGITTGEPLIVRVAMKPIATLMSPLPTVDLTTGETSLAAIERSDVTAVPAMSVIAEAMAAFVCAQALLEKFGGDSLAEVQRNMTGYLARLAERSASWPA